MADDTQTDAQLLAEMHRKLLAKYELVGDCWVWRGCTLSTGYALLRDPRRRRPDGSTGASPVHRVMYEATFGPIPDGLHIHHRCRERACINPAHLEALAPKDHGRAHACLRTHCKRGHEFTPENTIIDSRGGRNCRACGRQRQRAYLAAKAIDCIDCGEQLSRPGLTRCKSCAQRYRRKREAGLP